MHIDLPEDVFRELFSKLIAAGLPERQARTFAEQCLGFQDYCPAYFDAFEDHRIPSDECFRTLAEAQSIFLSRNDRSEFSVELDSIDRYLKVPYSDVIQAKKDIAGSFGVSDSAVGEMYCQDPEWLLITPESVKLFDAFLRTKFSDQELIWSIYKEAALLGFDNAQYRINKVFELLGAETGEKVIRNDLQGNAWLFYRWFTDPVGCISYMRECGLTPDQILNLLKHEPLILYVYKEGCKVSYNHDQQFIDMVIRKFSS
jgi:hypothetical protein